MTTATTNASHTAKAQTESAPSPAKQAVQVDIRLRGIEGTERPALSNFTVVQVAPGLLVVDFGYLEPQAFQSIAKAGRTGTKVPEAVSGQLASRVAIDVPTAKQLAQQLHEMLARLQAQSGNAMPNGSLAVSLPQ